MSREIALKFDEENNNFDIDFADGDIVSDFTINSSVITQIFTRSRLEDYQQPDKFLQNAWAGNLFFDNFEAGCKFEYIMAQNDLSQDTINAGKNEIQKALRFLSENNISNSIDITITTNPIQESYTFEILIVENPSQEFLVTQTIGL